MDSTSRDHRAIAHHGGHDAGPWRTALTHVERNKILVRGYPVDETMGRLSFGEAIYLLLVGELPSVSIGRLMEALLVATIDHGTTPPSTQAARNAATSGAPLHASVAAGILSFGRYHGGDINAGMRFPSPVTCPMIVASRPHFLNTSSTSCSRPLCATSSIRSWLSLSMIS